MGRAAPTVLAALLLCQVRLASAQLAPDPPEAPPTKVIDQVLLALLLFALLAGVAIAIVMLLRAILRRLVCIPKVVSFTATRTLVVMQKKGTECWVSFGDFPGQVGIDFEAVVVVPRGAPGRPCRGTIEFVQDVVTVRRRAPGIAPGTPWECLDSKGKRMLDTTDPYDSFPVGPGQHTLRTDDSPRQATSLPAPGFERSTMDDRFRMFLMWRPDRFGGRLRVPLAVIEWWWQAEGQSANPQAATCVKNTTGWNLVTRPTEHGHLPARRAFAFPATSPNVTSLRWEKC